MSENCVPNNMTIQNETSRINHWRTLITPRRVVFLLYLIGFALVGLGVVFFLMTSDFLLQEIRYDEICKNEANCIISFNLSQQISGNFALLYKLRGYFQNHRRIHESRSFSQLGGNFLEYEDLSSCSPYISVNDSTLTKDIHLPCGLMPRAFFNDSYEISDDVGFSEVNISLESDREMLYKPINTSYTGNNKWLEDYTDFPGATTNEHFIVWMRSAAMPNFLKLYSMCKNCTLPAGNYNVSIRMSYPTSMFNGSRSLVLCSTGALGSSSVFIYMSYFVAGCFSIIVASAFLVQMVVCPRGFGDLSMVWKPAPFMGTSQFGTRRTLSRYDSNIVLPTLHDPSIDSTTSMPSVRPPIIQSSSETELISISSSDDDAKPIQIAEKQDDKIEMEESQNQE